METSTHCILDTNVTAQVQIVKLLKKSDTEVSECITTRKTMYCNPK